MALLSVDRLSKSFGQLRAVDGVSFEIREGEIYGLLGPNGAGKTTTISMVCGLLRADFGNVHVSGLEFWSDARAARRLMGVVPQEIALYEELSGRENLEFWGRIAGLPAREAKARAVELLDALTLTDRANDAVKKYSGGMKRRINIGCALMHRPKLLLLDEPTVGIDPQARANILEFVRALRDTGTAILYTTHYLEEAETLCSRIGVIDHGKLLAEGTLADLRAGLGDQQTYTIEGAFADAQPEAWPGFTAQFRIIQQTDRLLIVAALNHREPAEAIKALLALPVRIDNVALKRPTLNDVFLHLTGRELRE